VNLDLQSNTWHNLTYAYQGEGGSRVTYLDGRKVAEDQAEDTFGDYPPFAMTGYAQGGYVVSASNFNSTYYPWTAFDKLRGDVGEGWFTTGSLYTVGGDGAATSSATEFPVGTGRRGEYLDLEMPYKLKVSYFVIQTRDVGHAKIPEDSPHEGYLYGSNDGINWTEIKFFSGLTYGGASVDSATEESVTVNSTTAYKYLRLQATKRGGANGSDSYVGIGELKYYGHRENDLVRLPDPTNVLKYPHIAMTGPAQRGYVASASTQDSTGFAYLAFDGIAGGTRGYHGTGVYISGVYQGTDKLTGPGPIDYDGEWIKLELPHKIKVTGVSFAPRTDFPERIPHKGYILGSNTGSDESWELVHSFDNVTTTEGVTKRIDFTGTNAYYKYIAMVAEETASTGTRLNFSEMEYFGTGVDSIPIQIGGGNIDKVANFRVYDKFIGEDQALEIWDAQKDAFRGVKNSMTLHKGRLGIGTTEPEGRLAVLDEPHNLEEFPPRAMTGYKTHFEGHGEFCVRVSSADNGLGIQNLFDKLGFSGKDDVKYLEWGITQYTAATGVYTGSVSTQGVSGEWLEIEMPYKIKLEHILLYHRSRDGSLDNDYWVLERMPRDGAILGSNNGETWTTLQSWTDFDWVTGTSAAGQRQSEYWRTPGKIVTNSTAYYKTFRLVFSKLFGASGDRVNLGEWRLFGTREQGQSVLHDGQLTLTKSLNVPRIGPALDADDTPRRDRLVVEYNTSTNPTFEGAVRDTSGRGNDGVLINGASYDATQKELVFDGFLDGLVRELPREFVGDPTLSFSMWINQRSRSTNGFEYTAFLHLGYNATGQRIEFRYDTSGKYCLDGFGVQMRTDDTEALPLGKWMHVCGVLTPGAWSTSTKKLYINGEFVTTVLSGTGTTNIPAETTSATTDRPPMNTSRLELGPRTVRTYTGDTTNPTARPGQLSSIKLYDCALTAEEVKTLYDMGRCDEGHHVVNFSKTRVGIGLGDGETPHDELDVRGNVRGSDNVIVGPYGGQWWRLYTFQDNGNLAFIGENGTEHGYLLDSGTVNNIDFTGQHRSIVDKINVSDYKSLEGLIVSANKNKYINVDKDITTGSNAIQISQSLPVVSLSNIVHDKACYGVVAGSEDPDSRTYEQGTFVSVFQKQKGDTRAFINSVGEGAMWVTDINGPLESGDYITTSNVAGYGQKQDSDSLKNYTVAKITMDCDFEPATQPVQQILRSNVVETYYLGNVHKVKNVPHEFVTTVVGADDDWSNVSVSPSDVTYAEWSNLEANTQNTYTLTYTQTSNVVYGVKYTKTTTANVTESDSWDKVFVDPPDVSYAEWSNLEANTQNTYTLTYTQTTTDEKTPDEWSTLESNVQSLYNKVYYQSVEEEVAATWPGAVAHTRVTDVIENELDEHGQIQWEDHPTDTEKAYKIRYLDASGVETDSANAVHIAAFVGCTYHCG
jgi:hypothetical protein